MRWKKRAGRSFGIILAFALAAAVGVPMLAWADEGSTTYVARIGNEEYPTLIDAAAAANAGDTVELLTDHTSYTVTFSKPVTLDLGGHTLTLESEKGAGCDGLGFFGSGDNVLKNGTVLGNHSKGTEVSDCWIISTEASLSTEKVSIQAYKSVDTEYPNRLINVAGNKSAVSTVLTLGAGTELKELDNPDTKDATCGVTGVAIFGKNDGSTTTALHIVDNASIHTTGFAIWGNGSGVDGTEIVINGGTITSMGTTAIYHPQYGTVEVTGGAITGTTGIEMRAGTLNVTGGTIKGAAEELSVESNPSGETTVGAGIAIAQHTTAHDLNVSIAGGAISGAAGLCESNPQENSPEDIAKVTLSVKGGTFTSSATDGDAIISDDKTAFITGGTFSSDPKQDYFATGYTSKPSDEEGSGYETVLVEGYHDVADFKNDEGSTYPEAPTGQAFAGWYTDETCAAPYGETTGAAYAKFVDVNDIIHFKGGSLRMDGNPGTEDSLRFGYSLSLPEGTTFTGSGWDYTINGSSLEKVAQNQATYDGGVVDTNLVLTGIPKASYATNIGTTIYVEYETADGTSVKLTDTQERIRSVKAVAQSILEAPYATQAEKAYAQRVLAEDE